MNDLTSTPWESLLPPYLTSDAKERLQNALKQFKRDGHDIDYAHFYPLAPKKETDFLQGDLLSEIPMPYWNQETQSYETVYRDAIIVSNACDLSTDNHRSLNLKQCVLAPLLDFEEYIIDLKSSGYAENKLKTYLNEITHQKISNLLYLPPNPVNQKAYIAQLDKFFWVPVASLNGLKQNIEKERITSLSMFGHYLFVVKVSYHLCRLPEEKDRDF